MISEYTLIEPCCGGAALSLHLLGAGRSLLPYQGSKWRYRRLLAALLAEEGAYGPPQRVILTDPGAWGGVLDVVLRGAPRAALIERLMLLGRLDARAVYGALHLHPVPNDPIERAAQFLFLQRLAYSGKAVGMRDGRWASPGFNTSSAYGIPGTDRFGPVRPMIPALIDELRALDALAEPAERDDGSAYSAHVGRPVISARTGPAVHPAERVRERTIVYIDPPYEGVTTYPDGNLDRGAVLALARAWRDAGASVLVSEGMPLDELVRDGWTAQQLRTAHETDAPFRHKQAEWVTLSPGWGYPLHLRARTVPVRDGAGRGVTILA